MLSSAAVVERPLKSRSVVSNGRLHPRKVDLRSSEARRFRDLMVSLARPFGGIEGLSESERALIRSCATLTVEAERLQARAASGKTIDLEALVRVSNSQARLLSTIRRGKAARSDRGPQQQLGDYLAAQAAAPVAEPVPVRRRRGGR